MLYPEKIPGEDFEFAFTAETMDDDGAIRLIRAMRGQAIKDHIWLTANNVASTKSRGSKKTIEWFLHKNNLGGSMDSERIIKYLRSFDQEQAQAALDRIRAQAHGKEKYHGPGVFETEFNANQGQKGSWESGMEG